MRTDLPVSHVHDAYQLESRGYREFFKLEFADAAGSIMYISPKDQVDWLGQTWQFLGCNLTGVGKNSNGEQARPKFTIVNPQGLFSLWVEKGVVEGSLLTKYKVFLPDFESGVAAYEKNTWTISKIVSLDKNLIVTELRSLIDGQNYMLPARQFYPPDFPHVSLG